MCEEKLPSLKVEKTCKMHHLVLTHFTSIIWGPLEAWWARALWSVTEDLTFSRLYTRVQGTGGFTALVDAAAVIRAGIIRGTANSKTLCVRITLGARWTVTDCFMLNTLTHSFLTTRFIVGATYWSTLTIATYMCGWAVIITITPYFVTSNLRITFITTLASAKRMMFYYLTIGIGTTLTRIFTKASEASFV